MRKPSNDTGCVDLPSRLREGKSREAARGVGPNGQDRPTPSPSREREGREAERTCILTRRKGSKDQLIRLALGPDGQVAPDVRARAPGRGAWISVTRAELDAASVKGKLKGALARAFKTNNLQVPADIGARTEAALRQAALDRLGMEARSGNLINGSERVETAARTGKVHLLIHAADAGEDGRKSLDQAWRVGGGRERGLIFPEGRSILSMALGRENVVHIALTDPAAASRVAHALARWRAFNDPDRGPEGGEPALRTGSAEDLTKD